MPPNAPWATSQEMATAVRSCGNQSCPNTFVSVNNKKKYCSSRCYPSRSGRTTHVTSKSKGQVAANPITTASAPALALDCYYAPPLPRPKGPTSAINYYESPDNDPKPARNRDAEWVPSPVNGSSPPFSLTGHRTHWTLGADHSPVNQPAASVLTHNVQTHRLPQPTSPAMSSRSFSPTGPDSATPMRVLSPPSQVAPRAKTLESANEDALEENEDDVDSASLAGASSASALTYNAQTYCLSQPTSTITTSNHEEWVPSPTTGTPPSCPSSPAELIERRPAATDMSSPAEPIARRLAEPDMSPTIPTRTVTPLPKPPVWFEPATPLNAPRPPPPAPTITAAATALPLGTETETEEEEDDDEEAVSPAQSFYTRWASEFQECSSRDQLEEIVANCASDWHQRTRREEHARQVDPRPPRPHDPARTHQSQRRAQSRQQQRVRQKDNSRRWIEAGKLQALFKRYPRRAVRKVLSESSEPYSGSTEAAAFFLRRTYEQTSPSADAVSEARAIYDNCQWATPS